ncbi:uncharacterized protein LOC122360826 [Puntigrus tetrazona]|uniref:uncharacterized protein LOC122360826 n=1 Tax=Puntigrus tetrazona TaxID=1606681 RepID=UPI001C8B02D8|nr:uncharacterized protein LOC122360826 [Puntigrus tetrazona]
MAMSPVHLALQDLSLIILLIFFSADCHKLHRDQLCRSTCPDVQKGQRHTYRYSTTIASAWKGPTSGGGQLALDCVVDIDVRPGCPEIILKLRNIQIKHSSSKRDNLVLRLKNIRESLEKNPLRFWLEGGKVTKLCSQEAEQVWTLNIKRSILSMFQTSRSGRARETVRETDVYGTCVSSYEQRAPSVVKSRNLQQCFGDRVRQFWRRSVPLKEGMTVSAGLACIQLYDGTVLKKVNCTETVSLVPLPDLLEATETKTVSSLTLLRTLEVIPVDLGQNTGYLTSIVFEAEGRHGGPSVQEVSNTVRRLCAHLADQQQQSELLLNLVLQLRTLSSHQLRDLWQEASFKCRDDWQPLVDALSACGTEDCILVTTNLIINKEVDQEHVLPLLSTISFASHPTSSMISHLSVLLQIPLIRPKALLVVSSLVHGLCQREQGPCNDISEVQQFVLVLKQSLDAGCEVDDRLQITELLHVLKAAENAGAAASDLIPTLSRCVHNQSVPLELRLAAVRAFRRIPCHHDRTALAQAFQSLQENVELRIAAYQQLMTCPNQEVFTIVKTTLSNEKSSQVGSFVWSHLFNIQKTEDPLKKDLMESLPDDILSKDFEAETWKYSSHMDYTIDTGVAAANIEGAVVFSPESFLPRYVMANLTVHILGRAFNLLEISLRMENLELVLKKIFEEHPLAPADHSDSMRQGQNGRNRDEKQGGSDGCRSAGFSSIKTKLTEQRKRDSSLRCFMNVKMFGNDLAFMTCDDLHAYQRKLSLNTAGVVVKLLKGQEIKISQRPIVLAEELVLPSLSGLPMRLSINMSTLFSLRLKGIANYKNWSHFSLAGYVKPNALVALSVRAGVDGAFGRVGLEWVSQLKTFTSLDGAIYLHHGQSLKVVLNTPEDVMDVLTFNSRMFRVSGDSKEELIATRNLKEKSTCTPKTWSKMVGWQLCSDFTYPLTPMGKSFPALGPVLFSFRLQKLDKGLNQYLLEAAYTFVPQRISWMPLEATLLLFLGTPQSTIPRDVSLDFNLSPKRLILKITHPLKTVLVQAQIEELNNQHSGRIELLIDNIHHYFIKGLLETVNLPSETRAHFHLDAKVVADGHPFSLSVNTTHARSRRFIIQALLKNVFNKDASLSVQLERSLEDGQRRYSIDAGFLLPNAVSIRALGLLRQRDPEWSSAVRVRYGVQEDSLNIQECHMTQNLHSESDPVQTYRITAVHELHCSHFSKINHKIHLKHERSPVNVQSSLDVSFGKQWNQSSNKHRILFSQSLRNQSGPGLTSYAVELSLRLLDRGLSYRTQLLHSYFKKQKSESSTHLKINYNNQMPLVAGVHWKDVSTKTSLQKWEGSFNMDTPWLYIYVVQKLTQPQRGITQFSSEVTTRKLVNIRSVTLEGFFKDRGKERQGQLHLFTPTASYFKVGGWNMLGKRGVKASYSISSAWTPALHGQIYIINGKQVKTLEISAGYGKQDLNISAVLSTLDKKLKKRLLMMTMILSDLKNPYAELQMEGAIEEIRKERKFYQKRWKLNFRQPFKFLPQSLILQETFTSDLHQKVYILESKLLVHGNKKAIHVLTLGFQPQQPYVCSSIVQSFSTERIPQDSKICVTVQNHQTAREIQGRLWTGKDEILAALGQVQLHDLTTSQQGVTIKANLSQLFEPDFPTSVSLDLEVLGNHRKNSEFEYYSEGKVTIDDKNYHANAAVKVSPLGNIGSSISLKANEKNATLRFNLDNEVAKGISAMFVHAGFHQTLFPGVTSDGHIHLAANLSSESLFLQCTVKKKEETFSAHLSGTLPQLSLSADIFNSIQDLTALPNSASLVGVLNQSKGQTEGELTLVVDDAVYGLEVTRRHERNSGEDLSALLCLVAMEESLCVNISSNVTHCGCRSLHAQLSHSVPWLRSAGLPLNSSAGVNVNWNKNGVCAQLELHAGASGLTATLEQSSPHTTQTTGRSQVNCTEGINSGRLLGVCSGQDQEDSLKVGIRAGFYNSQSSAFSFDLQGHHNASSIGLLANISHNVSALHPFLPFEFHSKSQLSRAQSSVRGTAELLVGATGLAFEAEISSTNSGFKQVLVFNHSIPQLHVLPKNLTVRTRYGGKRGSHTLTHRAQWETQDLTQTDSSDDVTHLQSYPELTGKVQGWGLDLRVENDTQRKLGDLSLDWILFGRHDQVGVQGSWTLMSRQTDSLEQKQPFVSTLTHFHIHALSHGPDRRQKRNKQTHLSREQGKPVNVSVTVSEHWHDDYSRGQACIFLSPGQIQSLLPLVKMEGCVAVAQEGKTYSQNTELKWKDKRITQSMKYQGGVKGMHTLLVELGAQNISPSPCPSHSLLTQIHTNLRDHLEHHIQIGLCPPQPALIWSGSHRVNSGKELLYTHTRVSVSGHPQHNTFTLSLRNISSSQRSNYSLIAEWQVGNWSVELACSSLSSGRNVAVQVHAKLDRSEMLWLQGALGKRCLRAAAGYDTETSDDIRAALCLEGHHWFTLEAQRGGRGTENETLTHISVGAANQSLLFRAKGCRECLWAAEARLQQLGSRIRSKLLDRVQRLQHLLLTFRRQAGDSMFLLELSEGPLALTQRAETLLLQRAGALWKAWTTGPLRHVLTHSLPHTLHVLHLVSQQVQQELRKPLATLAGAYHDVTGVRLDTAWQQGVQLWTRKLTELLPAILHDPHLRAPSLTALHVAIFAMDMVSQQTFQWMEARSAAMLVGIRRQIALMYKFSKSEGEVIFRVPLPVDPWLKVKEAGVTEVLLEEFVLKPLLALNSLSPTAEFYRLKRKIMDSPVNYQAFLVADVYLVSFDGHLFKLPATCDFVLATDVFQHTFSIALKSDRFKRRSLVVQMQSTKIAIHTNGEVEVNCHIAHIPYTNREVAIRKDVNLIEVFNHKGLWVSCDPHLEVCSVILDGWLHGVSAGLLGTNDNEAANELLLPDGSHTHSVLQFTHSWQVDSDCVSGKPEICQNGTADSLLCTFLFSSTNSPLSPCFRVVDPVQFIMKCEGLGRVCVSKPSVCALTSAYIHLCHRNYVPLELPVQCV